MNTIRIAQAVRDIETNVAALKWLEEHGRYLTARDRDSFSVDLRVHTASACPGAKEAVAVLNSFARFEIEKLVQTAITNCRNTIEIAQATIVEEASRGDRP